MKIADVEDRTICWTKHVTTQFHVSLQAEHENENNAFGLYNSQCLLPFTIVPNKSLESSGFY